MSNSEINVMGYISIYSTNSSDMTVEDVRKWLKKIEELGIPGDTRLDNCILKLNYRVPVVSSTSCQDCAPELGHSGFAMFRSTCREKDQK